MYMYVQHAIGSINQLWAEQKRNERNEIETNEMCFFSFLLFISFLVLEIPYRRV